MAATLDIIERVAYGTFRLKGAAVRPAIFAALDAGYRHIDTAHCYRNEAAIGEAVREYLAQHGDLTRRDLFVTTKVPPKFVCSNLRQGFEESAESLNLGVIDRVLLHWPAKSGIPPEDPSNRQHRLDAWRELESLRDEGRVREIGVSNFTVEHLEHLLDNCNIKPCVDQVEMHPMLQQTELRQFCHRHDIVFQAYSPLGAGNLLDTAVVSEQATKLSQDPAQILLRWALDQGVHLVVKSATPERIRNNIRLDFALSPAATYALDALNANHHFCWNPTKVP